MRIDLLKHLTAGFLISGLTAFLIYFWSYDLMILSAFASILGGLAKEYIWDKWLDKGTWE